ncbi:hypothetical protein [Natronorarus salvus]|uniref:hypothetical protein n=1 Tax=Natronorarus salvus TaxID=3117733 RepID=UPI002F2690B2
MTDTNSPGATLGTACLLVGLLWPIATGIAFVVSLVPLWTVLYGTAAWLALGTVLVAATRRFERTTRAGSVAVGVALSGLLWTFASSLGWWVGYTPFAAVPGLVAVVVGVAAFAAVDPGDGPALDDWERENR